MNRRLLNNLNR